MNSKRSSRANSTDVARLAGVSIAAVSRAYKPGGSISPETAEKVFKAARQLNYVPNTLASSLITRQTNIVALMLANLNNPIYSAMLDEASRRLEKIGKQILLFTPRNVSDFDQSLARMLNYQVDAIVIAAATISSQMASLCLDRGVPVVMLGRHVPGLPVHSVRGNARDGGTKAAALLLQGGGKAFGIIGGPSTLTTMVERQDAVLRRLRQEPGLPEIQIREADLTYTGGFRAAIDLMNGSSPPDSLICLTDIMALGAMDALRFELGLNVPDDVAVIGFDDITEASHQSYSLTTVKTPVHEMIDHMMILIGPGERTEPTAIEIDAEIVMRNSVRKKLQI